jgi:hypothetical protein
MKILACTLIAGMLCPSLSAADEHLVLTSEEYQIRRLLEPSPAELAREVKGSVYIYDGLQNEDIEAALDREFDRMEFMMFIRIKDRKPDGEVVSYHDDDDC